MITIPHSCFTIIYLFKSPFFFSLLPFPYLLHFLISNFPLISQLLIYSTFIIIQNNPISSLIPSKLINKLKKKKNLPTNPRSNLSLPLFSLTISLIYLLLRRFIPLMSILMHCQKYPLKKLYLHILNYIKQKTTSYI